MENSILDLMAHKFGMNSLKPSKVIVKAKSYRGLLVKTKLIAHLNLIEGFFPLLPVCSFLLMLLLMLLFCLPAYF